MNPKRLLTLILALGLWAYPLGKMVFLILSGPGSLPDFWDPTILTLVLKSISQAFVSAAVAVTAGILFSFPFVADPRTSQTLGRWGRFLLQFGFLMAPAVASMAGLSWMGSSYAYQWSAVIAVHAWINASWATLLITDAVAGLPQNERDAAVLLGARPLRLYLGWAIPRIRTTLLQSFCQIFLLCLSSFTIVALVGGGPPVETLETALAWKMRLGVLDRSGSLVVAFWQGLLVFAVFTVFTFLSRNVWDGTARPVENTRPASASGGMMKVLRQLVIGFFAVSWLPILLWIVQAANSFFGPKWDPSLAKGLSESLGVSLGVSGVAVVLCSVLLITGFWVKDAFFQGTLWVASGVSPMLLAMSWTEAGLETSGMISVGMAQGFLFFPLAFRFLQPWVQSRDPRLLWSAQTLGASPWRAWWDVEWPRLKSPVLSILAVTAAFSWGDTTLSTWFFQSDPIPLALWVARLAGNYRFEEAQALSVLLACLGASASFFWVRNTRRERASS